MEKPFDRITDSELEVMRVLWDAKGDALPLSDIREALCKNTGWESSTIKTLVQRLHAKGALSQEKRGVYYYAPVITREEYNDYATRSLINKLYRGRAKDLVAALVAHDGLSDDDVAELRAMFRMEDNDE